MVHQVILFVIALLRIEGYITDFLRTASIEWFSSLLSDVVSAVEDTSLDIHVSIFVTCLCHPEDVPSIPNSDVTILRPSISKLLQELVTPPSSMPSFEVEDGSLNTSAMPRLNWIGLGGGIAVCAAGPESLTRETSNAVARMGMIRGVELGGIGLHTELFAI